MCGRSCLFYAVQNENIQLITILIANFSSCFAIDSYGQSIVPLKDRSRISEEVEARAAAAAEKQRLKDSLIKGKVEKERELSNFTQYTGKTFSESSRINILVN